MGGRGLEKQVGDQFEEEREGVFCCDGVDNEKSPQFGPFFRVNIGLQGNGRHMDLKSMLQPTYKSAQTRVGYLDFQPTSRF